MVLGSHLRELRTRAGLSQRMLASRVGIDVTYLSKLENGRRRISEPRLRSLAEALGAEPASLLREAAGAPPALAPPQYRTRFIDRDDELGQLRELLEPAGALVAVTGPPGCGKTRLMAELATEEAGGSHAVAWITVRENDADRIAAALPAARLRSGGLVVLDDADRDLDGCASIARRLVTEGATVVATSRQPLGIYGEQLLRLTTLPVPNRHLRPTAGDDLAADPGRLKEQVSVKLFLDRAALARPGFRLDRGNAPAVFDLCRWLDGLPLAIELAAMRLRQMTVADLAASTPALLPLLTGNPPDVPHRHASLTAAIGWSFDRLDEAQRAVATRLSVFESTFSLGDAVDVASDGESPPDFVTATVMDLVDRSLLIWGENADGRAVYRWLRPVRQYGQRRLDREADRAQTVERYRSWARRILESHHDNLPHRESEWERLAELTPELVSTVYDLPAEDRADALAGMAGAVTKTLQFGNLTQHVSYFNKRFSGGGLDVFREAGMLARVRGELEEAHRNFDTAYQIAKADRDEAAQSNAALDLAENACDRGEYPDAKQQIERASTLYQKLEDDRGLVEVLNLQGRLQMEQSKPAAAEEPLAEALRRAELVGDKRLVAYSLHSLGVCDYLLRRVPSARSHLEESLRLRQGMRNQRGAARVIETFALVESDVKNHELVLELLGAARQYRYSSGMLGVPPWWQKQLERVEEEAVASLAHRRGKAEQCRLDGFAMTLAEAGELAVQAGSTVLTGRLGDPASEPLRRQIPSPHGYREGRAGAVAAAARELDLAPVESGGTSADANRRLLKARLLALAEPIDTGTADLLCFAVDPSAYRGVVVPVFSSGRALAAALDRCPEWASRPVVEIGLLQLRSSLTSGETAVVNPWTEDEHPIPSTYAPSIEVTTSMDAPAEQSVSVRRS
jgi:predicted ATPase/DNA-binding XRE family transcriptional regulator